MIELWRGSKGSRLEEADQWWAGGWRTMAGCGAGTDCWEGIPLKGGMAGPAAAGTPARPHFRQRGSRPGTRPWLRSSGSRRTETAATSWQTRQNGTGCLHFTLRNLGRRSGNLIPQHLSRKSSRPTWRAKRLEPPQRVTSALRWQRTVVAGGRNLETCRGSLHPHLADDDAVGSASEEFTDQVFGW